MILGGFSGLNGSPIYNKAKETKAPVAALSIMDFVKASWHRATQLFVADSV